MQVKAPLGIGEILDWSLRLYRRAPWPVLGLSVLFAAPYTVAMQYLTGAWSGEMLFAPLLLPAGYAAPPPAADDVVTHTMLVLLGSGVIWTAMYGGLVRMADQLWRGETPAMGRALVWSLRRLFAFLVTGVLVALAGMLFSLVAAFAVSMFSGVVIASIGMSMAAGSGAEMFGVIMGLVVIGLVLLVYQAVWLSFLYVPQVLMVENRGYFGAIGRSFVLVWGHFFRNTGLAWAVLGFWAALSLVRTLPILLWSTAVGATGGTLVAALADGIVSTLVFPLLPLATTVAYYDLRLRTEGYDIALRLSRLEQEGAGHA